ncbi:MarR family transcriptional regulator [Actinoplanes sp. NPDC051633]|uniref:MarR family winged helix-turn-helix transcriptional regulator n=1 Tax=Actinoplanes sp. NPDC051633 TaxID=3155670 RepID=UPI003426E77E
MRDGVDAIIEQWAHERPDLDTTAMAVFGRVFRLAAAGASATHAAYMKYGIGRPEFDVLATLRRSGAPYELPPSALATSMMLSSGGTTARLDRLEKTGLIVRRPSESDRRSVLVRLTEGGLVIIDQAVDSGLSAQQDLLRHMAPERVRQLSELLREALQSS